MKYTEEELAKVENKILKRSGNLLGEDFASSMLKAFSRLVAAVTTLECLHLSLTEEVARSRKELEELSIKLSELS